MLDHAISGVVTEVSKACEAEATVIERPIKIG